MAISIKQVKGINTLEHDILERVNNANSVIEDRIGTIENKMENIDSLVDEKINDNSELNEKIENIIKQNIGEIDISGSVGSGKIYEEFGDNTDGSISQAKITEIVSDIYKRINGEGGSGGEINPDPTIQKTHKNLQGYSTKIANKSTITELSEDTINDLLNIEVDKNASAAFYNLNNLESFPDGLTNTWNTSYMTNTSQMFSECNQLSEIPYINTTNVVNMSEMFRNCKNITTIPEIKTSNVTSMFKIFCGCSKLTTIPFLNTSNVKNMNSAFSECTLLSSIYNLDTSKVTNMINMFRGCSSLPSVFPWPIDLSNIDDTDSIKNIFTESSVYKVYLKNAKDSLKDKITSMLLRGDNDLEIIYTDLNELQIIVDKDINNYAENCIEDYGQIRELAQENKNDLVYINITNANSAFKNCEQLQVIPNYIIETWDTSDLTDTASMFNGCRALKEIKYFDTRNVTDTSEMFNNCSQIEILSQSFNFNNSTDGYAMFNGCTYLNIFPTIDTGKMTDMRDMFKGCTNLPVVFPFVINCNSISDVNNLSGMFTSSTVTKVYIYAAEELQESITSVLLKGTTGLNIVFTESLEIPEKRELSLANYYSKISNYASVGTLPAANITELTDIKVTSLQGTFYGCKKLYYIQKNITGTWNTSSVTSTSNMFANCNYLQYAPYLNTENVTVMSNMFYGCNSSLFTKVPKYNTSKVTSMSEMFNGCTYLLEVPEFDTSNVTNMNYMFNGCINLTKIPRFNTSKVTTFSYMFQGCSKLSTIPQLDTSKATNMSSMFGSCSSLPLTFPWVIDCSSIESSSGLRDIFYNSTVTQVYLYGVKEELQSQITGNVLGKGNLRVIFVDSLNFNDFTTNLYNYAAYRVSNYNTTTSLGSIYLNELTNIKISNLDYTFSGCAKLNNIPEFVISTWNTDEITNTNNMLYGCEYLSSISLFNTSKVTNMDSMFYGCKTLTSIPQFNMKNVESAYCMFCNCTNIKTIPQINTGKLKNMSQMFYGCTNLTAIPELNTTNVTNMYRTFYQCTNLKEINNLNISNLENANYTFGECTALTKVTGLGSSKITNTSYMFYDCYKLNEISKIDTSKVTDMRYMFASCGELPITFPWVIDCSSIETADNMENMFSDTHVSRVYLYGVKDEIKSGITASKLGRSNNSYLDIVFVDSLDFNNFVNSLSYYCSNNISNYNTITTLPAATLERLKDLRIDNLAGAFYYGNALGSIPQSLFDSWNLTGLKNTSNLFSTCSKLINVPLFDTSEVTNMNNMFYGCSNLTSIPEYNTGNVESMYSTFYGCAYLTSIPLLNTSKVTTMYEMFRDCKQLTEVPQLDTSNVTSMYQMFYNCVELTTIPQFDTSKVTDMYRMFYKNNKLVSIPQLNTSNVTTMYYMFYDCNQLKNIPKLDTSKVTNMQHMFEGCQSLPKVFPWVIDCSSITSYSYMESMFYNTNVIRVKLYGVRESIKSDITSSLLFGNSNREITFVNKLEEDTSKRDMYFYASDNIKNYNNIEELPQEVIDDLTDVKITDFGYAFNGCAKLKNIPESLAIIINLEEASNANFAFGGCSSLTSVPKININNVNNINSIFNGCSSLEEVTDLSAENATTASYMFGSCIKLNKVSKINLANAKDIQYMFNGCTSLTEVSELNIPKAECMNEMFYNCSSLVNAPELDMSNVIDTREMFEGCISLTKVPKYNTSKVTNMSEMFRNCSSLSGVFPWVIDCSSITSYSYMSQMFYNTKITKVRLYGANDSIKSALSSNPGYIAGGSCSLTVIFVDSLDDFGKDLEKYAQYNIKNYSTITQLPEENITDLTDIFTDNLESVFYGCSKLESIPQTLISSWDINKATSTANMFYNCNSLTTIPTINTSNINSMSQMFYNCTALITIPELDTKNVTTMYYMFGNCKNIDNVSFNNTDKLTNMNYIFYNCESLENVSIPNTKNVNNMAYAFNGCKKLTNAPELDMSNVTSASLMFKDCTLLTTVPVYNTNKVTDFTYMFSNCKALPAIFPWTIDCSNLTSTSGIRYMFENSSVKKIRLYNVQPSYRSSITSSYIGDSSTTRIIEFVDTLDDFGKDLQNYAQYSIRDYPTIMEIPEAVAAKLTNIYTDNVSSAFNGCNNLRTISQELVDTWDTSNITTTVSMFSGCNKLTVIPLFNTANVTNMNYMFDSCKVIKTIPEFNTTNVTTMNSIFRYCESLQTIPELDTASVTNMSNMFYECYSLRSISQLNTMNVTDMSYMFYGCTELETIPEINTHRVSNMQSMFMNCTSLPEEFPWEIDCYSISSYSYMSNMFYGSSVTKVKLKNVNSSIKSNITSSRLKGDNTLTIEFIN